jgi:hypothetical protein
MMPSLPLIPPTPLNKAGLLSSPSPCPLPEGEGSREDRKTFFSSSFSLWEKVGMRGNTLGLNSPAFDKGGEDAERLRGDKTAEFVNTT